MNGRSTTLGLFAPFLCLTIVPAWGVDAPSLKVGAVPVLPPTMTVKNHQPLAIRTKVSNSGAKDQELHIWACSYGVHWKADVNYVQIVQADCDTDNLLNVRVKAGESYTKELYVNIIVPEVGPPVESVSFRLAFQPWEEVKTGISGAQMKASGTIWSEPITVNIAG